jgi:Zn-dependent M28 family amino/carboxypeptidase
MKIKLFLLISFLSFTFSISAQESVQNHLNYLASDELMGRETGTEGIHLAASYIEDFFKKNNVQPYYETYRDSFQVKNKHAFNVVGLVEGTDPKLKNEYIIIGAHYDHIGKGKKVNNDKIANGANDNASGTVVTMELAKHFSENPTKRSLIFVLFAAEEMGLLGSKHLAKRMKEEQLNLYSVFNIEMVGVPMIGKSYLAYFTGFEESNFAEKFNEYAGNEVLGFLPQAKDYQLFKRSDNYPFFQEFKIPAQTACTFDFTNYDYYHHVDDEVAELNMKHIQNVVEAFIPGLEGVGNSKNKEIKLN